MCGITGIFTFDGNGQAYRDRVLDAVKKMRHRGPDSNGAKVYKDAVLGHSRLAIIDLSERASQPFEYGGISVVFNGEIYNYKELRQELISRGFEFNTDSDTEVLAASYLAFGREEMLNKLNGDFAFAVYDKSKAELFVARDRYGIKPLYFINNPDYFAFASELNAIESYFDRMPGIDTVSLKSLFEYTYIPAPFTIYKEVKKLAAGSYIIVSHERTLISSYYELERLHDLEEVGDKEVIKNRLYSLLDTSVRQRLTADVEVGTFLSGGIDSSIVSALAKTHLDTLHTFNIGFPDYTYYDETVYAKEVARHIGSKHTVFDITEKRLSDTIEEFLDSTGEPFADSSSLAFYILSKETAKQLKVVLSGDGADEIFGGYNKHRAYLLSRKKNFLLHLLKPAMGMLPDGGRDNKFYDKIRKLKKFVELNGLQDVDKYKYLACFNCNLLSDADFVRKINGKVYGLREREMTLPMRTFKDMKGFLLNDVYLVLQNDMLYKADYYSMLNSLEVRVPFLDHNVVEYAFSIPVKYKLNGKKGKMILRETFASMLPDIVFNRPKHGFEIPLTFFIKDNFTRFSGLFDKKFVSKQNIFTVDFSGRVRQMLESRNHTLYSPLIWTYVVFQNWWKKKFDN